MVEMDSNTRDDESGSCLYCVFDILGILGPSHTATALPGFETAPSIASSRVACCFLITSKPVPFRRSLLSLLHRLRLGFGGHLRG